MCVICVVKRKDQKDILIKEGAQNVVVTEEGWEEKYIQLAQQHKADCLIDSLGSGDVLSTLKKGLVKGGLVLCIGALEGLPPVDILTNQRIN